MSGELVVLGVSGGIACYKAAEVLRGFQRAGCEVAVVMTENATRFVAPLTFAALSGRPVAHGGLGRDDDAEMAHVDATREAALFVVAPATANTIAKLAHGIADDWLGTHALASTAPLLLAPAMNQRMWAHPSVAENLETLRRRGAAVVPPEEGELACGELGPGRLAEPERIVEAGLALLRARREWEGRRVLVTSGPTFEDVDPVRFVGNRSSGKMGHALAAEAAARGADTVLVTGPVGIPAPAGCRVLAVRSAEEMAEAVAAEIDSAAAAFFAAAVADFRPRRAESGKIRRSGRDELVLELERTRDVLGECIARRPEALLVGFAAETEADLEDFGRRKLEAKGCDLLVANRVGGADGAFGAEDNEVLVLGPGGRSLRVPRAAKRLVAGRILDEALAVLEGSDWKAARRRAEPEKA